MLLTEQRLAQAKAASSSLAALVTTQQLLLHPVAAIIVPFGLFPWLPHFHAQSYS